MSLRRAGRMHQLSIGRAHKHTAVILLIDDLDIRVIATNTGELLRHLTLNPNIGYQPRFKSNKPPEPGGSGGSDVMRHHIVVLSARYSHPVPKQFTPGEDTPPPPADTAPLQKQTRLDPEQIQRMIADYQSGLTIRQVAAKWNMNRKTVSIQLRRAGVTTRPAARKLKTDQIDAIVASYEDGASMRALGKEHAVHPATIKNHLLRNEVQLRT